MIGAEVIIKTEKPSLKVLKEIQKIDTLSYGIDEAPLDWYKNRYKNLEELVVARKTK